MQAPVLKCVQSKFGPASHSLSQLHYVADVGVSLESLLDPSFWSSVTSSGRFAGVMTAGAVIHVDWEDFSRCAILKVRSVSSGGAVLAVLEYYEFDGEGKAQVPAGRYKADTRGRDGHCVVDTTTGKTVAKNLGSPAAALAHIEQLERADAA